MYSKRKPTLRAAVLLLAAVAATAGCERGPSTDTGTSGAGCPAALARASTAVRQAERHGTAWNGPTSGPSAVPRKSLVYVAQTMTNPGVAGVAKGMAEAARITGWNVRVIDGEGTPAGIQAALSQAITLRPSGIVIGGFDPLLTSQQVARAQSAHIPLIGWHAVPSPGPSTNPRLFTNVTTKVQDVARISADWVIVRSHGNAGTVVFTDDSIPFARNKAELIKQELDTCAGVKLLAYENIPIPDASQRTPQEVSSLVSRFGKRWTYSVAINDLYFADAAPALRAAGKPGSGPPFNIGAGTGIPPRSSASTAGSTSPPPSPSR